MAEKYQKILHKRSVQSGVTETTPKLPDASILEYGEIAINYGKGHEALSIKNNQDEVVSLRTDEFYQNKFNEVIIGITANESAIELLASDLEETESVMAAALADLDERIINIEDNGTSGAVDENAVRTIVNNVVDGLDATVESTNGSFVNVKIEQTNGVVSNILITESDIASANSLTQETNARVSGDTQLSNRLDILEGNGDGSINKKIDNAFNEFAAKVSDDNVVNTYKELIDYAATHGSEFTELVGTVTSLKNDVDENEEATAASLTDLDSRLRALADNSISNAFNDENLGYTQTGQNYPLLKDANGKLFVTVDWENSTYSAVTEDNDGLMLSTDKVKLDSIVVENGKVTNIDAFNDNNLGYIEDENTFALLKDESGKLYVSIPLDAFEMTSNKVNTLTSGSTDQEYPTAKAVYDAIIDNEEVCAAAFNELNQRLTESLTRVTELESLLENMATSNYESRIAELERKLAAIIVEE